MSNWDLGDLVISMLTLALVVFLEHRRTKPHGVFSSRPAASVGGLGELTTPSTAKMRVATASGAG